MTRVDFYLLSDADGDGKYVAACKLVNKAFQLGHRIYILTDSPDVSEQLDRMLWTFAAGSFIPHQVHAGRLDATLPVIIGHQEPPEGFEDVLVSLAPEVPPFYTRFKRVADIVGGQDTDKQRARERFRFYRDNGCPPQTHNL